TVLVTQDHEYFQFKTDILARTITYSTDKKMPVNLVTIPVERAKEIIRINNNGEKPEQLEAEKIAPPQRQEYVELVGQDSLTRFDKKTKKKKKSKTGSNKDNTTVSDNKPKEQTNNNRQRRENPTAKRQAMTRPAVDNAHSVRKDYNQAVISTPAKQRPVVKPRQGRRSSRQNNTNSEK
ncbi:MAG: hypothetical protein K2J15_03760, partial [Muribaculaceae bacterium]|nr:hypothetical protein [Muribaculaceae bacterium]